MSHTTPAARVRASLEEIEVVLHRLAGANWSVETPDQLADTFREGLVAVTEALEAVAEALELMKGRK